MDVFLQEHGKTIFTAVCILLLVGVAYAIGPMVNSSIKNVISSYSDSVSFSTVTENTTGQS